MRARAFLAAVAVCAMALPSSAEPNATARRYAVLSLLGDSLLVVNYQIATGSNLDRNERTTIALAPGDIDGVVLETVDASLHRAAGAEPAIFLKANDPAILAAQAKLLQQGEGIKTLEAPVRQAIGGTPATHLILIMKYRHQAVLQGASRSLGSGLLEGVGFYLDRSRRIRRSDTGERGYGLLAPFAYFRVMVIDLAGFEVLKDETITASHVLSAARASTGDAWDVLSAEDKIRVLREMVRRETRKVLPAMLQEP